MIETAVVELTAVAGPTQACRAVGRPRATHYRRRRPSAPRPARAPRPQPRALDLIAQISRDNRLWGTERIRGELLKLGIVVSNWSIRRYRWRKQRPGGSQAWRTFLRNHIDGIWAADLFVVQTVGYQVLYVMFFISHRRRKLVQFNVTSSPTAAWVWRQLIETTAWTRLPSHLIHDRDAVYGRDFEIRTRALGIIGVQTPRRAPNANAIAERIVRSIRVECLDHLIVINECHLIAVLREFIDYYNHDRPHRSLALTSPVPIQPSACGPVTSRPVLGGLHHAYGRAA